MSTFTGNEEGLLDEMLGDFLDESDELLNQLNEKLLQLDEWAKAQNGQEQARCDSGLINEMFRAAHSLKGLSAMLGLDDINGLTHKVENVLDAARNDRLKITSSVVELIFQSVDRITSMIENLKSAESDSVEWESLSNEIQQLLQNAGAESVQRSAAEIENEFDQMTDTLSKEIMTESVETVENLAVEIASGDDAVASIDHFAEIEDETDIPPKYLSIFIDETEHSLDSLSDAILSDVNDQKLQELMGTSHQIKGSAASIGLHRPAKLAHFMEDLLQDLLQRNEPLSPTMADTLLHATDALREYVDGLKEGAPKSEKFNEVYLKLVAARHPEDSPKAKPREVTKVAPSPEVPAKEPVQAKITEANRTDWASQAPAEIPAILANIVFEPGLPLAGLKARLLYERLDQLGTLFYCEPPESSLDDLHELGRLTLGLSTLESVDRVRGEMEIEGVESVELEFSGEDASDLVKSSKETDVAPKPPSPKTRSTQKAGSESKKPMETIRVDIDRLDHLMNLAGQLVNKKAQFSQIGEGLKSIVSSKRTAHSLKSLFHLIDRMEEGLGSGEGKNPPRLSHENLRSNVVRLREDVEKIQQEISQMGQARNLVNDLFEAVHQLDRVSSGIQKSVMDTRMVPVGPLFSRFKRVIRDITSTNGKEIRLEIRGENTELDKRMIDELGDPLIHMIRNCADHGIELPEEREASGKPRQGTVTLDAFHRGNSILIQVTDDGKGLSLEKIRSKAVEKGIVSPADAKKLTQHQTFQLIWEPGFSTAEKITEVSGRGMGMDIVRTKIENLSGTVELESNVGEGTKITIKLPLTLAILPSLMAQIDGEVFAIPVESVNEIVRVDKREITTLHGMSTARVRGRVLSIVHLDQLFTWNRDSSESSEPESDDPTLVILGASGQEMGLVVHRLLGEEDIVIKSMAENYQNVEGIAGASVLGDGRVSLILDVGALLERATSAPPAPETTKEIAR